MHHEAETDHGLLTRPLSKGYRWNRWQDRAAQNAVFLENSVEAPPFDLKRGHRWFAVELNNLAWDLVEAPERSQSDIERMIHAAHGACFHWLAAGNVINHLRAQCLLSTAYAKAGLAEAATRHAQRCLQLSREAGDQQTAFDRATAHGCASVAYELSGRMEQAFSEFALATAAAVKFTDPGELPVFERLYPSPGQSGAQRSAKRS